MASSSSSSKAQLAKADFKAACKYIESGVAIEESGGDKNKAKIYYRRAIKLLDEALARPSIKNAVAEDIVAVRHKMQKFRGLCVERLTSQPPTDNGYEIKPTSVSTQHRQAPRAPSTNELARVYSPRSIQESKTMALEKLKKFDKVIVNKILDDVLTDCSKVTFDDIAGNEDAKEQLRETVIYPALRPDLFTGLREPVRGILLFGPPGNGKTLLAKAVANESKCVFLNISAASILSKWVGESERYVKTLFAVARALAPAIIFIDEVDALLMARKDASSNSGGGSQVGLRVLTQFLAELDGVGSDSERILVLGATNRPQELDDAALRRFPKRLLIPMPNEAVRVQLLNNLLKQQQTGAAISQADVLCIARSTDHYSASDLTQLAKDAALGPIRSLKPGELANIPKSQVRSVKLKDFQDSLSRVRPSLSTASLNSYVDWNRRFGDSNITTTTNSATFTGVESIGSKLASLFTS